MLTGPVNLHNAFVLRPFNLPVCVCQYFIFGFSSVFRCSRTGSQRRTRRPSSALVSDRFSVASPASWCLLIRGWSRDPDSCRHRLPSFSSSRQPVCVSNFTARWNLSFNVVWLLIKFLYFFCPPHPHFREKHKRIFEQTEFSVLNLTGRLLVICATN